MSWINDGEKFALIGLNMRIERDVRDLKLPVGYSVLTDAFRLPEHWRNWLGSNISEEIEGCCSYLVVAAPSENVGVLDGEYKPLQELLSHWYFGIILSGRFSNYDEPFTILGSREEGNIEVRSFGMLPKNISLDWDSNEGVKSKDILSALKLVAPLHAVSSSKDGSNWRLKRCLAIYRDARCSSDILERIHQYVRCIDGLIVSDQGNGRKQFKSRTELFVGSSEHDAMGDLYDFRGHVEHLHEHIYFAGFDRDVRLKIAERELTSEYVARNCLTRILMNPNLMQCFGNVRELQKFWSLQPDSRRDIWGKPFCISDAIDRGILDDLTDRELGGS